MVRVYSLVRIVAVWLAMCGVALAQQGQGTDPEPGFDQEDGTVVDDESAGDVALRIRQTVVVSATRSEVEIDRTPLSASVITTSELEARPVQNVDQQLTLTPGVYVQRFQGFSGTDSNVYLRGLNGSARTLVLLDGQPMNDAYASGANWTGIPTGQLESIEVARGPFSSLYGGNALGGVISIRTRPVERRAFYATGEYGTYDSNRLTATFADRLGDRLGLTIGGERFDTDGYNSRVFTATPRTGGTGTLVTGPIPSRTTSGSATAIVGEGGRNRLTRYAARVKAEVQASPTTIFSVQYLRMQYDYAYDGYNSYLRDAEGRLVDSGSVVYNDGGTLRQLSVSPNTFIRGPGEQQSNFVSGTFQHAFDDGSVLRVDAGMNQIPSYQFRSLSGGNTLTSGPGSVTDGTRRTSHANVQLNRSIGLHGVTVGGETRQENAFNSQFDLANWTNNAARGALTYYAGGRAISQAAYVQDQIAVGGAVLVLGGRYDFWRGYDGVSDTYSEASPRTGYPARSAHQLSGKAALGYAFPNGWNLRFSVGNAFRSPNVYELYATSVTGSGTTFASNPALTPETLVSWEAGVRKRFGQWTSVDGAYFENRVSDLIYRQTDLDTDPNGSYRINMNAGGGRTRGVELALQQRLVEGMEFRATYTYTDAIITSNPGNPGIVGNRVTSIPDHMASGQLIVSRGRIGGSLAGRYTGLLYSTDTNSDTTKGVPGSYSPYFVMDASVSFQLTPRLAPFVTSENLLNRQYYVFYLSPGRTIFGGVRVRM
jgi:iron complex outermembrane receptor protein